MIESLQDIFVNRQFNYLYQLIILLISQILNGGYAFNCGNLNISFCFIQQNDKKSLYNSACEVFDVRSQWDSAYEHLTGRIDRITAILTFNLLNIWTSKNNRLNVGEGKEVNHERCSRSKLQLQCIRYLGPVSLMSLLYAP